MTHGLRTRRVIVFLHGLTNCPRQFQRLGDLCFARGDNVLIARLPRHGFADRMTPELARLTAAEMATFTDEVVDIGRGLGDSVTVAGLSLGGVMAAWAAQNRPDLDRAVVIAPLLGLPGVPVPLDRLLTRWWLATPNRFYWWDDKLRAEVPGPRYCYPRYGTKAIGELLELGFVVSAQASRERPGAREIVMVTNGNDHAIDNRAVASLADAWRRHGATRISSYEFPAGLDVGHDLIDPEQPYQRTETVYPKLLELLEPPPQPHDKE
jgi:carboxylesterase